MRSLFFGMCLCLLAGCQAGGPAQVITSTTDSDGTLHPVTLHVSKPTKITCLSATGNNDAPAKCNINGAPVAPPSESVVATDSIYFFCEGTLPAKCSAKVQ
jgi:hypothetical protein